MSLGTRHLCGTQSLVHEHLSRRPSFRDGVKVRLADDQMWVLPAPPGPSESAELLFGIEYLGLIDAVMEVQESSELRVAELALAIFLLGVNYSLPPSAFERLLDFTPDSSKTAVAESAFHQIATEHVSSLLDASGVSWDHQPVAPIPGRVSRFVTWLRNHSPLVWWSFDSRS